MSEVLLSVAAALGLGLLGSGHCLGMCGGVVAALSFAVPAEARVARWKLNLGYNLGRIATYTLMGGITAGLASQLPATGLPLARTLAAVLLIAMGLYLANWWRGLLWLERGGQWLWRRLKPLGDRFLPLDSFAKAISAGMVWGWLPCGLVYAALGYAMAQSDPARGALIMLAFGLGTLPALWIGGVLAGRIKSALAVRQVRLVLALAYMIFGIWVLIGAWQHRIFHGDHNHRDHVEDSAPAHHHHH